MDILGLNRHVESVDSFCKIYLELIAPIYAFVQINYIHTYI